MEAVSVGGLKRARGGASYNGPEAAAAAATLKKLRLDAAAAAAAAMNMPPTGHTPPLAQQQQAAQGAVNVAADGQTIVPGMCNSIDSVGPGEEEVKTINNIYYNYYNVMVINPFLQIDIKRSIILSVFISKKK